MTSQLILRLCTAAHMLSSALHPAELGQTAGAFLSGSQSLCYPASTRGVAQLGSAPAWGAGGRWFESSLPDSPSNIITTPHHHSAEPPLRLTRTSLLRRLAFGSSPRWRTRSGSSLRGGSSDLAEPRRRRFASLRLSVYAIGGTRGRRR